MMSVMLRARGEAFDPDQFLGSTSLRPCQVFRKGELRSPKSSAPLLTFSGINVVVSGADFDEFPRQVEESIAFLAEHRESIVRLVREPGVEGVTLDFGIEWRDDWSHCDVLPAALIRLAGELGLCIELSHYRRPNDDGENPGPEEP